MAKKTRKSSFSRELGREIARHVPEDGSCVTREELAEQLGKSFTLQSHEMLKLVIGLAVQAGEVPGCAAVRGPQGGVFRVKARETATAE